MNTSVDVPQWRASSALRRACLILLTLAAILAAAAPIHATPNTTIIYIVPSGNGNGTSWVDGKDLAATLAAARSGDELWVKAGTYKPTSTGLTDPRTATFTLKNGVALYGGFAGNETAREQRNWQANVTTLSGDLNGDDGPGFANNGDNSYHVVTGESFDVNVNVPAVLDGVTISGGSASGSDPYDRGGGMYNGQDASLTLANVTLSGNSAHLGGGMYNGAYSYPSLTDATFSGNSATVYGGGMANSYSRPTLTNVTFSDNSVSGGPSDSGGGGMYNVFSSPTLTNVRFSRNLVSGGPYDGKGGGMYNSYSRPALTNVIFSGNSVSGGPYGSNGGGMYNSSSNPKLTDVTFSDNSAQYSGGGMANEEGSSPKLTNVTFSGNRATWDGGGMFNWSSSPTLINATFSGNSTHEAGGGMSNWSSSPRLTNVTFSGNSANSQYGSGGGMENEYSSSPTLTNVTFSENSATYWGGGMVNMWSGSSPRLTNVIFSGNSASQNGGAMFNYYETRPIIRNSIFWGNSGGEIYNNPGLGDILVGGSASVSYSIVQGSGGSGSAWWNSNVITDGGHNLDADPLFVAPPGNLRLRPGSPAIDTGDNSVTNPSLPATDLDGNPRIVGGTVDLGAYEEQTGASSPTPTLTPTPVGTGAPTATPTPTGTPPPPHSVVFLPLLTARLEIVQARGAR